MATKKKKASKTDAALSFRNISTAMITGIVASTVMIRSRHRPES